ncbi:MAG TPA: hypothetical protein VE684_04615 [Crenalkalicoccus sp.]|nr:hypothetical protein [Crenalkalicoccus sp.]
MAGIGQAHAQISDGVVRVGVLNDISGAFQDTNGPTNAHPVGSRRCRTRPFPLSPLGPADLASLRASA